MKWAKPNPGKTKGYNLKRKEKRKSGVSCAQFTILVGFFLFLLLILVEMEHKQITFGF